MPVLWTANGLAALSHPDELASHYDLVVTAPAVGEEFSAFATWLAEAADSYGLCSARFESTVALAALERLAAGDLTIGLHVGCDIGWHPCDVFARLALAVQDGGGHPINIPARAATATDQTTVHHELTRHGLGVPPTVILRPWSKPTLTERQRWHLHLEEPGVGFQIIAATARYVQEIENPTTLCAALAEAREKHPDAALLVRPEIRPPWLRASDGEHRPAQWRVTSCLGKVTAYWWQSASVIRSGQPSYVEVTPRDVMTHGLRPIYRYAEALAELTGLEWFSADLALCPYPLPGAFAIPDVDGLDLPLICVGNLCDQSEVDVQSRWRGGVPDEHVHRLAWRFAELAWRLQQRTTSEGTILRAA